MSRPKSYDRSSAIEKACLAFWEHGYQSLGVRQIEALTGLNQYAIRSEFGGKEGLYLEALSFYSNAAISTALTPMKAGSLGAIETFLNSLVTSGSGISSPWGCLIVNTSVENAYIRSPHLEKAVRSYWNTLEKHLQIALTNAQDQYEIDKNVNAKKLSKGLVTAIMGIHAQNRATHSVGGGRDLLSLVFSHLNTLRMP